MGIVRPAKDTNTELNRSTFGLRGRYIHVLDGWFYRSVRYYAMSGV